MSHAAKFAYPVYLSLAGRRCLVIGGGAVALHKTRALIEAGATDIRAVALEFLPGFRKLAKKAGVRTARREFRPSDMKGAQRVICATNNEALNAEAARTAPEGALVNVVDRPALCNFIAPAIFRNGPITIAISTGGASPALAKKMRAQLAKIYNTAFARKAERLGALRLKLLAAKKAGDAAGAEKAQAAYFALLEKF